MTKPNKQSIRCDIKVDAIEYWKGKDFWLPARRTYNLIIDYPFSKAGVFQIKTGKGMGLLGLMAKTYKAYKTMYRRAQTDKQQGYWHGIEDLVVEGITVNHKTRKIRLDIGS